MGNASSGSGNPLRKKSSHRMSGPPPASKPGKNTAAALVKQQNEAANGGKHQSMGPANPKLEALQTDKEVQKQILEIEAHNPRKTLQGTRDLESKTDDGKSFQLTYGFLSQTGWYPDDVNKANQDMVAVISPFKDGSVPGKQPDNIHLFAVFDGHGKAGDACAEYAKEHVPRNILASDAFQRGDYEKALRDSYIQTNSDMHQQEKLGKFSDMMSGTTAISGLMVGRRLFIANVGDSRAIMGVRDTETKKLKAEALSIDQTPFREDERIRVKKAGARVLTMDQIEGYRDVNEEQFGTEEEDDGDPPRLWCQEGAYPGTAFTRSLGDQVAERIGVFAEPELLRRDLAREDEFLLIASDGVFEFLSSQAVVDIVSHYDDTLEACRAVVSEAYRLWLQYEVRTDDISVIIVRFKNLQPETKGPGRLERTQSNIKDLVKAGEVRPVRRNLSRVKQGAVGQMHMDPSELEGYALPVYPKSKEECGRIKAAVRTNFLFRHLNEDQLDKAVLAMETITVKAKDVIIRQFDEGDRFYIADFGEYDVEVAVPKTKPNPADANGAPIVIEGEFEPPRKVFSYDSKHGSNPCFGELALMYSKPRAATVKAKTDGKLWALERNAFRAVLMKTPARRLIQVLKKVEVLKPLSRTDLQRMADLMTEEKFADGQHIVSQGETGDAFYIVTSGTCVVTKSEVLGVGEPVKVMELTEYMYFGERALLHDLPRAANVIAVGNVKVLSIHRHDFEEVVGKIADIVERDRQLRENKSRRNLLQRDSSLKEARNDFLAVRSAKDLNGGIFANGSIVAGSGTLRIVQHDGKYCVLKSFGKMALLAKKEEALALNEMRITRSIAAKSVFVPSLVAAFDSANMVHLVFNSAVVVDLARFFGKPLGREIVQFIVAGLTSAFDFLHGPLSIVYRGLVPEAVGLDRRGVVQLCDFRFSKALLDDTRTFTICGTPEYMSPEQVTGVGHGFEADWWSLGILAFEALVGSTPWGGDGRNEIAIYSSISAFTNGSLVFPATVDASAVEFVNAVLRENPQDRLSSANEVSNHPFIKGIAAKVHGMNPFETQVNDAFASILAGPRVEPESLDTAEEPFTGVQGVFDEWGMEQ